ncbi:GNAT family N-acetyltransferase [Bacillus tropicus]|uniref:GNAT family N-acetyltransferase n=1 Tax=Bacillus tropicus TaxID=2026188 RepID=UPI001D0DFFFA|nr:GNAT family N-acetyltransferase [Bacillus tropicus]MCC2339125.1 GNAT family N-acetyltransferase [Bacillus tropicus]MCU5421751.1 GNAT family N-acetyltransferase [Bacillus tropicus]
MTEKFNEIPLHVQDFQKLKMLLEKLVQDEVIFIEGLSKYSLNISSKEHKVTINLRSEFFLDPYLVITAISITPSNQGKGSIVLEWFKTFAKEKGFKRLVLQEVITKEGYHFALKNGFLKKVGPFEEIFRKPDSTDGNYELHL